MAICAYQIALICFGPQNVQIPQHLASDIEILIIGVAMVELITAIRKNPTAILTFTPMFSN